MRIESEAAVLRNEEEVSVVVGVAILGSEDAAKTVLAMMKISGQPFIVAYVKESKEDGDPPRVIRRQSTLSEI